ncbi:isochorismatase family protein [Nakamurella sp. YIM 132087]|uniref:Isochorismatase family protein n=1 Tax=Nakamurella alba TaxID=2665158 RepID=A0A7K1FGG9_9ACTN|nr:isochorismatase family cysteine hydrolase [Nakamurella alba]MTD12393.1 isochorismatase family protein [Nakamurella alba]
MSIPVTAEAALDPDSTALIMWDLQNGLAGKAPNVAGIVSAGNRLVTAADAAGVPVFWSQHVFPPLDATPAPWLLWMMRKQSVTDVRQLRPMLQQGSHDVEFLADLRPAPHHHVLRKSQPSLFFDTPLDSMLKVRGVRSVAVCGFATDIGVEFTVRHATAEGYHAIVVEDACGAYAQENHDRSLGFLRSWCHVTDSATVEQVWSRAGAVRTVPATS